MKPLIVLGCLTWSLAFGQTTPTTPTPSAPAPAAQAQQPAITASTPEMDTRQEQSATFRSHTNLVLVPVVAHDLHGAAIGSLTKANFTLYDKGKPQEITRFSLEKVGSKSLDADTIPVDADPTAEAGEPKTTKVVVPERFVAYLFDDVHLSAADLPRVRDAALRHIATLRPTDRAAIYTLSGFPQVDYTDDQDRLRDALLRLHPNIMAAQGAFSGGSGSAGEVATLASLGAIQQVVQRAAGAPGQRIVVVISPGFMTMNPLYFPEKQDILDRANRANVIINALDARGLYTDPSFDVNYTPPAANSRSFLGANPALTRAQMQSDVLAEFASGTGGSFFQNSNDYDEGFRRLATAPEYVYMLGFSPQNLKNDGSFHALRVVVKPNTNLNVQARRGYYAPKKIDDAEETARQEIGNALFSREDLQELPMEVHTRFFKPDGNTAKMTVMLRLDLKLFRYNKANGRNNNTVTMVTGIFDRDGNYLQGIKKVLELHLKDETLTTRLQRGATITTNFDLTPGTYLVRQVVRDAEGQQLSASNSAVVIP